MTNRTFASQADFEEKKVTFSQISEHAWAYTAGRFIKAQSALKFPRRPLPLSQDSEPCFPTWCAGCSTEVKQNGRRAGRSLGC